MKFQNINEKERVILLLKVSLVVATLHSVSCWNACYSLQEEAEARWLERIYRSPNLTINKLLSIKLLLK